MAKLAILIGVLGFAGAAQAGDAPFRRTQPPPPPVVLSARVQPPAPRAASAQGPVIDLDALVMPEAFGNVRPEQEQILEQLIAATPDSEVDEKSDYYFRYANVLGGQALIWRTKDVQKAKDYLLRAVKAYRSLVDNPAFRNYPKLDRALFAYAYVLQRGNYFKEARAAYDKLAELGSSPYIGHAMVMLAEQYYQRNELADAEKRYTSFAQKYPKDALYPLAMYRLGAIELAAGRTREALASFRSAADAAPPRGATAELHRAAEDGAAAATGAVGPDAALAFARDKLAADPSGRDACRWQYEIARATTSPKLQTQEIEALVARAGEGGDCAENAAAMAGELARFRHGEFVKTRAPETLGYAERLYAAYVTAFPNAPDRVTMRAAYAEVLWSRAELEPTPEHWAIAAERFATLGTADRAGTAVLAWRNALGGAADVIDLATAASVHPAPRDIPPAQDRALAALAALGAPDAQEAAASGYRIYGHPERAVPLLVGLLDRDLDAVMLLDSLVRMKEYDEALRWVDKLAADARALADRPKLREAIKLMRSRSLRAP